MHLRHYLRRKLQLLYIKIVREKASPEYIARGWAIGMFFGCISPFGFQLILSIPTAFFMKGSKIGSIAGTFITNHVTIFFIYPAQCYLGAKLMNLPISFEAITQAMKNVLKEQSYDSLMQIGGELVAAFFIGGAIMAITFTPITYFIVKNLVIKYRQRRAKFQSQHPRRQPN